MKRTTIISIALLAQVAASACMNLGLLEEMIPLDAGTEGDGTGDSDSDGDSDADSDGDSDTDGPPDTDPDDVIAPMLITGSCGFAESLLDGVCVAVGPASASFRFATHEPAVVSIVTSTLSGTQMVSGDWAEEHHGVALCLDSVTGCQVTIQFEDVNQNADSVVFDVVPSGEPAVAITEVMADPAGPEPHQEFVEVVNFGSEDVDLSGWMIDDNGDWDGDLIPAGVSIAAGEVLLLVAEGFDPGEGSDPGPAAGTQLVSLDGSLGSGGLKNSEAETVELYDGVGNLVSTYDGCVGNPKEGRSAWRVLAEAPDDDYLAWGLDPLDTPTPGAAPLIL